MSKNLTLKRLQDFRTFGFALSKLNRKMCYNFDFFPKNLNVKTEHGKPIWVMKRRENIKVASRPMDSIILMTRSLSNYK
mgnify:CR=1 FL=1